MGRMYAITFQSVATATSAKDLYEVVVPSDAVMVLHRVIITQETEEGDSAAEMLASSIRRVTGSPTSGSGGSSATPVALEQGTAAAGITAEINNTTQLSGGTSTLLHSESWNVMSGFDFHPDPEARPVFSPSTYLVVELDEGPADAITLSGTVIVEEIGG